MVVTAGQTALGCGRQVDDAVLLPVPLPCSSRSLPGNRPFAASSVSASVEGRVWEEIVPRPVVGRHVWDLLENGTLERTRGGDPPDRVPLAAGLRVQHPAVVSYVKDDLGGACSVSLRDPAEVDFNVAGLCIDEDHDGFLAHAIINNTGR